MPNGRIAFGASPSSDPSFVEAVSPSMRPVEAIIRELAQSDVPVLLLSEPGAGKQATARRIHAASPRQTEPFLWLHCAAVEAANFAPWLEGTLALPGGTVYLEELADLSQDCQALLLEVLTLSAISAGNGQSRPRLICGSSRDLEIEVRAGRLSEDLYYRISGVCLRLPPLRQRKEDVPLLLEHFLHKHARAFQRAVPEVSRSTMRLFQSYSWPGNLRELDDTVRMLVAVGDEQTAMGGLRAFLRKAGARKNGEGVSLKAVSRAASREAEKVLILETLTRTRWNRRRAAEQLQISYKALLYKLKQIGCDDNEQPGPEQPGSAETI